MRRESEEEERRRKKRKDDELTDEISYVIEDIVIYESDWLGKKKRPVLLPYEEAKKVVNALGLKNQDDWKRWSCTKRPSDIPGNPWINYKNAGWWICGLVGTTNEQIYTYVIEDIIIDEIVKLGY